MIEPRSSRAEDLDGAAGELPALPADTPVLDPAVLDSLRRLGERSGRDVLGELSGLYLSTATAQVRTAADLLRTRDLPELARIAHALKGSSSVIGARRAAASALALEDCCGLTASGLGGASVESARTALAVFADELERFRAELRRLGVVD